MAQKKQNTAVVQVILKKKTKQCGLLYTDCSRNAGPRHTHFTHESYLDYLKEKNLLVPILLALCTGFRLECILVDVLHAADLGMTAHIIGNIMWESVLQKYWGASTQDLDSWYKKTKCKVKLQGKLTQQRIRAHGQFPKLKSKAAAARHLADYALDVSPRRSLRS